MKVCTSTSLKDWVKAEVLTVERESEEPWEQWKELILKNPLKKSAPCVQHPFKSCGMPDATELLSFGVWIAGSICKDWSSMNQCKKGKNGPYAKLFLIWAQLVRTHKPLAAMHENVTGFDDAMLHEVLGDLYHILVLGRLDSEWNPPLSDL